MTANENKLDNPVWFSLMETHQEFAISYGDMKFYHPDYCPFGGFTNLKDTAKYLDEYAALTSSFYVVGDQPNKNSSLCLNMELVCNQMVLEKSIEIDSNEEVVLLNATLKPDLLTLVNMVQPGYFKNNTPDLGNYYGIYKNNELVAVTGERMKMNTYTEVSAVVTHPQHTGNGYAKKLVVHTANAILLQNKIPYLHVATTNIGAIKLYEKLGFVTRREISFWNFTTAGS